MRFLKELAIDILNTPEYENRTIHFESAEEIVFFSFDQTLLTRAFRNFIINAFVHGEEHTEVTLCLSAADSALKICISDNGAGMEAETIKHLFDRYYRGTNTAQNPEGSGLGLAIAKSMIELHNGTISVSSIPAVGTTFQIEFPLYCSSLPARRRQTRRRIVSKTSKKGDCSFTGSSPFHIVHSAAPIPLR